MSGILYVVATPIGNLEDVTLRALRILGEVSMIAAEDTRRTSRLLQHYSISTPTTSLHAHNEHARTPMLIDRLRRGDSVALVSDAGTPVISDPGARLVAAAHEAGVPVQPVPGPSAVAAIVSAAGVGESGFTFAGFAPARANNRKQWLGQLGSSDRPIVLYEAPHRVHALLSDIKEILGERMVAIGRELTKIHEQLAIRPISGWLERLPPPQGEFVAIIYPSQHSAQPEVNDQILAREFLQIASRAGITRRDALRTVAARHGVAARRVFDAVEAAKKSGE
jgi:16S rRNA (cytidine1402-2'-O)-methyltransferase